MYKHLRSEMKPDTWKKVRRCTGRSLQIIQYTERRVCYYRHTGRMCWKVSVFDYRQNRLTIFSSKVAQQYVFVDKPRFSSNIDGIQAPGKAHMRSTPTTGRFPAVAVMFPRAADERNDR